MEAIRRVDLNSIGHGTSIGQPGAFFPAMFHFAKGPARDAHKNDKHDKLVSTILQKFPVEWR
jgi:hypothetical protein